MEIWGDEITLSLRESVALPDFADLTAFGEFASTEPLWDLVARLPPDSITAERIGLIHSYDRNDGTIEVARRIVSSEGFEGEKWELYFRPSHPVALGKLQPNLQPFLSQIPSSAREVNLSRGKEGLLVLFMTGGLVDRLYLAYPERESIRPLDSSTSGHS
jgi:hypothetical protein